MNIYNKLLYFPHLPSEDNHLEIETREDQNNVILVFDKKCNSIIFIIYVTMKKSILFSVIQKLTYFHLIFTHFRNVVERNVTL